MRMDPRTRFLVELLARVRGQSISTVVERAIQEAADNTTIGDEQKKWREYWHVNEGIRFLKLASDQQTFPSFDDEAKAAFTKTHWPFFYTDSRCKYYKEWAIEILWPQIDNFLAVWNATKTTEYFAAGNAMRLALSEAGVAAPEWPPKRAETDAPATQARSGFDRPKSVDLDDDIPF